jgi:hypothetical protein
MFFVNQKAAQAARSQAIRSIFFTLRVKEKQRNANALRFTYKEIELPPPVVLPPGAGHILPPPRALAALFSPVGGSARCERLPCFGPLTVAIANGSARQAHPVLSQGARFVCSPGRLAALYRQDSQPGSRALR